MVLKKKKENMLLHWQDGTKNFQLHAVGSLHICCVGSVARHTEDESIAKDKVLILNFDLRVCASKYIAQELP